MSVNLIAECGMQSGEIKVYIGNQWPYQIILIKLQIIDRNNKYSSDEKHSNTLSTNIYRFVK